MSEMIPKELIPKVELTRRQFLKAWAATAAVAAVGERLFDEGKKTGWAPCQPKERFKWVYSWCRQCALPPWVFVRVKDGVAVQIEGDVNCPTKGPFAPVAMRP